MQSPSPPEPQRRPPFSFSRVRSSITTLSRLGLALIFALQVITASILLITAALRKQRKQTFPHLSFDESPLNENRLKLYCYGHELYADMLTAIDQARETIYLESYIWKDDEAGWEFKKHLARKAAEGVEVYVIFDGFGNLVVPQTFKTSFHPHIHVFEYQNMHRIWHLFDPRHYSLNHRKLLIVDGHTSFIGGYNIGSLYADFWRDTHLRICGPSSAEMAQSFIDFWNRFCVDRKENTIQRHYPRTFTPFITLHSNDAFRLVFPIRDMYIEAISRAEKRILLTNAYFIPDRFLLSALKSAAQRGVDVRILVPWQSNHILADWISHSYYSDCLQAGIRILGYRHAMLHAKTCTIDGQWSTIGTANLDRLSSIGNYEINVEIYSADFARQMEELFACDTNDVFEVTLPEWQQRPWYAKLSEKILKPLRFVM